MQIAGYTPYEKMAADKESKLKAVLMLTDGKMK